MQARFNIVKAAPEAYKAVVALEEFVQNSGLERRFIHLIKLRASIINGCAYCVDMHVKESRHDGLSEQWINMMSVWKESPVYDARERALLGWVDAVTNIAQTGAPDDAYEALKAHFSEEEMTKITVAIGTINVWNRLAVGFRSQHPLDKPAKAA
ncbi:carboxymuconolactone decarboxylase family protein [Mycoplana ramosa]|uniref:Carboxymuconolactone decarboxylase family protein n=1 Tax=Mycoplana ramosa TaxID=40837 RepID=A0ABW3YWP3_MYCRA